MTTLNASDFDSETSLIRGKCLPDPTLTAAEVPAATWHRDDLLLPAMTIRASAVRHNLALQSEWLQTLGVDIAPHAKTHLSPELTAAQLDAGAWGFTVASVHQARLLANFGARRVLIAQELAAEVDLGALNALRAAHRGVTIFLIADSAEVVTRAAAAPGAASLPPLPMLVELGMPEGRTGARSVEDALKIARQIARENSLMLAGIEGFEGILPPGRDAAAIHRVDSYLDGLVSLTRRADAEGLFTDTPEVLITAGGSSFPDRVANLDPGELSSRHRIVLRSGGTVVHDHGDLADVAPLAGPAAHPLGVLEPALEVWASVVSCPEPGVALMACGKRDVPYDSELPVVLEVRRGGELVGVDAQVTRLNDQHGYLEFAPGSDTGETLQVGDVVRLGPCHPCTAFDKWAVIPVLGDDDRVTGVVRTYF